jgi:hypothetical protein
LGSGAPLEVVRAGGHPREVLHGGLHRVMDEGGGHAEDVWETPRSKKDSLIEMEIELIDDTSNRSEFKGMCCCITLQVPRELVLCSNDPPLSSPLHISLSTSNTFYSTINFTGLRLSS